MEREDRVKATLVAMETLAGVIVDEGTDYYVLAGADAARELACARNIINGTQTTLDPDASPFIRDLFDLVRKQRAFERLTRWRTSAPCRELRLTMGGVCELHDERGIGALARVAGTDDADAVRVAAQWLEVHGA